MLIIVPRSAVEGELSGLPRLSPLNDKLGVTSLYIESRFIKWPMLLKKNTIKTVKRILNELFKTVTPILKRYFNPYVWLRHYAHTYLSKSWLGVKVSLYYIMFKSCWNVHCDIITSLKKRLAGVQRTASKMFPKILCLQKKLYTLYSFFITLLNI